MKKIVVIGAGKIGSTIARLLSRSGDYEVSGRRPSAAQLADIEAHAAVRTAEIDIADRDALRALLAGHFAVLSAAPYHLTTAIAEAAADAGVHYLDLTEDVESTRQVQRDRGATAKIAFIPQCGLAPGFISIVANDLASRFDTLDSVRHARRRAAAISVQRAQLQSHLEHRRRHQRIHASLARRSSTASWSKCRRWRSARSSRSTASPTRRSTRRAASARCARRCKGKVRTLNYRTIRYPGHAAIMKALLNDLGLRHRREVLKDILENALPTTTQDVVIIFVTVSGRKDGRLVQETYAQQGLQRAVAGKMHSAIQITTAGSICAVLDLLAAGPPAARGFIKQEEIGLADFLANRFGHYYAKDEQALRSA